jgi:hypothetical protein
LIVDWRSGAGTPPDRDCDFVFRWKPERRLSGDAFVVHPDRELTAIADDQFGVQTRRRFNGGRRTGGPRLVVSGLAVADSDVLHRNSSS